MPKSFVCHLCGVQLRFDDRFCSSCGTRIALPSLAERLTLAGIDPTAVWLWESGVNLRLAALFAQAGLYLLSDVLALPNEDIGAIRGVGASNVRDFDGAVTDLLCQADAIRTAYASRTGTYIDPAGPVFGMSFWTELAKSEVHPRHLSIGELRLHSATESLFRRSGIRAIADLDGMTNIELVRRLCPRTPSMIDECGKAAERLLERLGARSVAGEPLGDPAEHRLRSPDQTESPAIGLLRLSSLLGEASDRHRTVLDLRFGIGGMPAQTLEEVGKAIGTSRERVRQIERKALEYLVQRRRLVEPAYDSIAEIRKRIGLSWGDDRLLPAVSQLAPGISWDAGAIRLLSVLFTDRTDRAPGIDNFEAAVVAVLGRHGPLPLPELIEQVMTLLDPADLARFPYFSARDRIVVLGSAVLRDDGLYELPARPVTGFQDKRMRRLLALVQALERLGPSHFTAVSRELERILPAEYVLDVDDVHAWLGRYPGMFVWAGPGTYGLKSQEVGISADRERTALDAPPERRSRRRGIGDEIEWLLAERGKLPIEEIADYILARFSVKRSSILAAMRQDRAGRFAIDEDNQASLKQDTGRITAT